MVVGQSWIGTLAMLGHVPDARDRTGIVVVPLDTPRRNGTVVHGTSQREVGLDIKFQIVDDGSLAAPPVFSSLGIEDEFVQEREPVPRGRL